MAFGYGASFISQFEMSGEGIQFFNWNISPNPDDQLTFVISLVMMLVDAVIYMLLAWLVFLVFKQNDINILIWNVEKQIVFMGFSSIKFHFYIPFLIS